VNGVDTDEVALYQPPDALRKEIKTDATNQLLPYAIIRGWGIDSHDAWQHRGGCKTQGQPNFSADPCECTNEYPQKRMIRATIPSSKCCFQRSTVRPATSVLKPCRYYMNFGCGESSWHK
jgi:hypothetical protein